MLTIAWTETKDEKGKHFFISFHTQWHENRNDRFCCAAQKKKYDSRLWNIFHTRRSSNSRCSESAGRDFISRRLVSALLFVRCSDISRPRGTAAKSQSDSKCGPASATAQSRLVLVRCGAELAGRVKCGPEQARAGQAWVRPRAGRPGRGESTSWVPVPQRDSGHISYGVAGTGLGVSQTRNGQVNFGPEQAWASRLQVGCGP